MNSARKHVIEEKVAHDAQDIGSGGNRPLPFLARYRYFKLRWRE